MSGEPVLRPHRRVLTQADRPRRADWVRPRAREEGLSRVLRTLRERWLLIVAVVAITLLAAAAYVALANKVYKAQSSMLVSSVPDSDATLSGLGLIRDSADPTRGVETAAQLVTTPDVATRVVRLLHLKTSPTALLNDVSAAPVAQSNLITVTAQASTREDAKRLADAFATQAVVERTDRLRQQLAVLIPKVQAQAAAAGPTQRATLATQLAQLKYLNESGDPTLRIENLAQLPAAPASPRKTLSLAGGLLAGLALGVAAALALELVDPRLRREEQLRELYRLPILARIPRSRGWRRKTGAVPPADLPPGAIEGYRVLRMALEAQDERLRPRSVLVTGPSLAEGKTTTSINLAASLAAVGRRVVLVEGDLRRPAIGAVLDAQPKMSVQAVLSGYAELDDAVTRSRDFGASLDLLVSDDGSVEDQELLGRPGALTVLRELKKRHDWVVVDAPPLNLVADSLPLARATDDVLIVVRLGKSKLPQLRELAELLAQQDITPAGFVLLGVDEPDGRRGYGYER